MGPQGNTNTKIRICRYNSLRNDIMCAANPVRAPTKKIFFSSQQGWTG